MNIAGYTVGLIFLIILTVDVYVIFKHGSKASISAFCIKHAKKHPIFPFVCGILFGHIFWSMSEFDWTPPADMKIKCDRFLEQYEDNL